MIDRGQLWKERKARYLRLPPESNGLEVWIADVQDRAKRDQDTLGAITGRRREGKSTLARKLARRIDPKFDIERQCCFSFDEVRDVSEELEPGQVIVWDEIIDGGLSRDWNTKKNKDMEKFFTISGDLNLVAFALAPHIDMFDPSLRRRFFTDWILKESRRWAKIHVAGRGGDYPGKERGWMDICRVECTADSEVNDEIYRAKKDAARRGIGGEGSEDTKLLRSLQVAADRHLKMNSIID